MNLLDAIKHSGDNWCCDTRLPVGMKGKFVKLEFPVSEVDVVQTIVDKCFNQ